MIVPALLDRDGRVDLVIIGNRPLVERVIFKPARRDADRARRGRHFERLDQGVHLFCQELRVVQLLNGSARQRRRIEPGAVFAQVRPGNNITEQQMLGKGFRVGRTPGRIAKQEFTKMVVGFDEVFQEIVVVLNTGVARAERSLECVQLSNPASRRI
jgi:hypothetical protein